MDWLQLFSCLFTVFENKDKIVIVMEYASKGELYDYISERRRLSERETRHFFRQIVSAVHHCHKVRKTKLKSLLIYFAAHFKSSLPLLHRADISFPGWSALILTLTMHVCCQPRSRLICRPRCAVLHFACWSSVSEWRWNTDRLNSALCSDYTPLSRSSSNSALFFLTHWWMSPHTPEAFPLRFSPARVIPCSAPH